MGKTKLFVGLILLIVGAGLVPTGIVLDNRINEQLDAAIPGTLLEIRDGFLPAAADLIKFEAVPEAMLGLKDEMEALLPYLLNGSITAQTINGTITGLAGSVGIATAKDMFFNDVAWSTNTGGVFPINSVSEVMGQALGFTTDAQDYILYGNGAYPGLITDLTQGEGIYGFLQLYAQSISPAQQTAMSTGYNATWEQLTNISAYLSNYMFPLVPTLGSLPFAADSTTAPIYFLMQWANATLASTGIPLPIGTGIVAWELGVDYVSNTTVYNPSNFSLTLCTALWDATNETSPFNTTDNGDDGYHYWYSATMDTSIETELSAAYGMESTQFDLFTDYLFGTDFQDRVIIPLVEYSEGVDYDTVVLNYFYLQWSTGVIIPTGIGSLGPEFEILTGFEIILPADQNPESFFSLGLTRCRNMWDPENNVALTNGTGIQDWLTLMRIEAANEQDRFVQIQSSIEFPIVDNEFDVSRADVVRITDWLRIFRYEILPKLAIDSGLFFMHPTELANMLSIVGITAGGLLGFVGIILIISYRKR